jgi:tight adherence protein B
MSTETTAILLALLAGLAVFSMSMALTGLSMHWAQRVMSSPWAMALGRFPTLRVLGACLWGVLVGVLLSSTIWGLTAAATAILGSRMHTQVSLRNRLRAVERQIPEFCDAVSGALRAGATLRSAIAQAKDQLSLPIREEIERLQNLLRLGLSQEEALDRWADSSGLSAVRDLAFCAGVSSRSGGSLAPLVETIGQNLAAELALQAKADALTSQGRLQAIVMVAIPPALLLMTGFMDSGVWAFFFGTTFGTSLLWGVFVLEFIGLLWIRKITRVRRSHAC